MSSLKDEQGNEIPRQQIGLNRWMIQVHDIPALGTRRFLPTFSKEWGAVFKKEDKSALRSLKTDFYECAFDEVGRLESLRTIGGGEIVDANAFFGDAEVEILLDSPRENEHCSLQPCVERRSVPFGCIQSRVTNDGELFTTLEQRGRNAHGTAVISIRFWKHLPRIDFNVRFDLPETTDKLCARILFPVAGEKAEFMFDQNAGVAAPDMLLPGSIQELLFCSRFALLNAHGYSAVLCCPDAPCLEFGGKRLAEWNNRFPFRAENNHVHGLIYNNICNTDAPAWSHIRDDFSFSLFLSDSHVTASDAQQMWESTTALSADFNSQASSAPCVGLSRDIRMHADESGTPWLENLTGESLQYSFTLHGKRFSGELSPYQITRI